MTVVIVWNPIERTLWGVALTILLICGALYLIKGTQTEKSNEKILLYGFSSSIIGYTLYFLSYYLLSLMFPGAFIENNFYFDTNTDTIFEMVIINFFGELLFAIGFVLFLLTFESIYKRTKYLLIIIQILLIFLRIILPDLSWLTWYAIFAFSNLSVIIILYYLTKWSRFEFKAISSLLLFGLVLFGVSITLFNWDIRIFNIEMIIYLSPIFCILGGVIALCPLILKSDRFLKVKGFWLGIGSISIILSSILVVFFVYISFYIEFSITYLSLLIMALLFTIVLLGLLKKVLNIIKSQASLEDSLEDKVLKSNLLKVFSKPQKVTEEEVSISKEKGICLVCKGEIGRLAYICPECKALYCDSCSKALSNLENLCWVCDTPFDESKPVKSFEKQESKLKIETKDKKN